jgi:LDH2 family malate/lactate/ureidoglycolate dehydrogenase
MIFAMRVDNFQPVEAFKEEMDRVIREIRDSERIDNVDRIWMPGEMEHERILERKEKGIPLAPVVIANLNRLAAELNLTHRLE